MSNKSQAVLEDEWRIYHTKYPEVYTYVCRFADEVIKLGYTKYAIATIWERIRWHVSIELGKKDEFKLPNNHRAYYSRLWLAQHANYPDFFRIARLRSVVNGHQDRYGRDLER
jgi:hypothetical protein